MALVAHSDLALDRDAGARTFAYKRHRLLSEFSEDGVRAVDVKVLGGRVKAANRLVCERRSQESDRGTHTGVRWNDELVEAELVE